MARRPKVLVAKTGLDGHWRGVLVVASTLRDAGFEVVMLGMANAEEIAASAAQEDVDLVGLNVGGRIEVVERIVARLRDEGVEAPIIAGGTIPPQYADRFAAMGIETFPPGSPLEDIAAAAHRLVDGRADA